MRISCALGKGHREIKLRLNFSLQDSHYNARRGKCF
ncbi:rCG46910 [Rattus norvegicus]|uniref:RCG46910 n=1 Tax=Rattus norvegicus TaxID=10116 RepID=A6IWZ7_RAT|nr:rCG46910 [Rattus norvegicus]